MIVQLTVQTPHSLELDQIIARFTAKLEPVLFAFAPALVRLHGRVQRHREPEGVVCELDLHLPTAQMQSRAAAPAAQIAFRSASEELMRQVLRHKDKLRLARPRERRREAMAAPPAEVSNGHTVAPAETHAAVEEMRRRDLGLYMASQLPHLQAFVARQLRLHEHLGETEAGRLEASEVLDELVVDALATPPQEHQLERDRWFLVLAARAIRRLIAQDGGTAEEREALALALEAKAAADTGADGDDAEDDGVAGPWAGQLSAEAANPEEAAYNAELVSRVQAALAGLAPRQGRDLMLYLLEGFTAREVALVSGRSLAEVRTSIRAGEAALRRNPELVSAMPARCREGLRRAG